MKKSDVLKENKRLKVIRERNVYVKKHNYEIKTVKSKLQKT